jgi:phosphate transport system permease protein
MTAKRKRILVNYFAQGFSVLSAVAGITFLFWILWVLFINGFNALNLDIFRFDGAPPGVIESGLRHALVGQLILALGATVIGVPIGILAGTYLSEYGINSRFSHFIRDISDTMMSTPSIVIGTFVYAIVVAPMGHFSGWAGIIALAIMMVPIVLRTTDDMLSLVPRTLREAAAALGAPKYKVIIQIVYRSAKIGILTGILLSIARISGETAPLLFTSFNNNFFSTNVNEPIASLSVTMFNYAVSPYEDWQQLGWAAAFILTAFILGINILGRIFIQRRRKY